MRPKVLVTRRIPAPAIELLEGACEVTVYEGEEAIARAELMAALGDKDGLVCIPGDLIDAGVLDAAPSLKVISTYSVGYDHIDVAEVTARGIFIGYTPDALTDATADLAFALLVASARRIAEADRHVRAGEWQGAFNPMLLLGESIWESTLGIVGFGRIGRAMALRGAGFRMSLLYHDAARLPPEKETEAGAAYRDFEELLKEADFVTLHLPYSSRTHHLIGERELKLMKPTAMLINTSRGPVVDENALIKALEEGWIAAAGLDVYEHEPLDTGSPLLRLPNVTLTPHVGSATRAARRRMAEMAAGNLLAVLKGQPPIRWLNPEAAKVRPLSAVKML